MIKFPKEAREIVLAPLVVAVAALALFLIGRVPTYIQGPPGVRDYSNIDEARAELGFVIMTPSYFPSYLSWPSASIRGQFQPVLQVQMLFLSADRQTEALLISQIVSDSEDLPVALPWVETALEQLPVTINGNNGVLTVGRKADGQLVNGVNWRQDGFHFAIVTTRPVRELLTLARSMHP